MKLALLTLSTALPPLKGLVHVLPGVMRSLGHHEAAVVVGPLASAVYILNSAQIGTVVAWRRLLQME
jgi:hypothetical protein